MVISNWAVAFVVGVLLGWLLKWALDRGKVANCRDALAARDAELDDLRAQLQAARADAPAARRLADLPPAPVPPDDLTRIEGIGPQIAGLLNAAGIHSFVELSGASPERLTEILRAAGPRFQMAQPSTWPAQARLAAAGEWTALERLQQELKGGL